jgi:hypothetical protein
MAQRTARVAPDSWRVKAVWVKPRAGPERGARAERRRLGLSPGRGGSGRGDRSAPWQGVSQETGVLSEAAAARLACRAGRGRWPSLHYALNVK